ncbi:MAG: 23S rRNA (uracil(1939)-C(5))-methyltransferase RlmD [Bacteroidales bacterium]|nr:23S rRNA (uracil(1939)-C(5))-methyltransferase RlmD [Bacteroidales bacterium]
MRRSKKKPIVERLEIINIAAEGKAIGKIEGKVIFVPGVIPGDIVDVELHRNKKSHAEGVVLKFHQLSDNRIEPECEHFGVCGGCKWQQLPYASQIAYKHQQVLDQFTRIGHIEIETVRPILGSASTYNYRNKLEFTFSDKRWLTKEEINTQDEFSERRALGFHIPKLFDKVIDVQKCHLQGGISNDIRNAIRTFCFENDYTFFNIKEQHGMMRNLIIRNTMDDQWMVIVSFFENNPTKINALMQHLKDHFPQITSLQYVVNEKRNDTILDQDIIVFNGQDHIVERMENLQFKVGPKSFYQTNAPQAYELYKITRDFAQLKGDETVYDLYTGTGTIALFVSQQCKKVVGIEYVEEAIIDAKNNAQLNHIDNASFFAGDMKDVLNDSFIAEHGRPDVIIVDPPRAGMHADVVDTILKAAPKRIVYVSCNPATQARDIALLNEAYQTKTIQPVDMFPHTHHVENVALLELRKD